MHRLTETYRDSLKYGAVACAVALVLAAIVYSPFGLRPRRLVPIAGVPVAQARRVEKLLTDAGIRFRSDGSRVMTVWVERPHAARAIALLRNDARTHAYRLIVELN